MLHFITTKEGYDNIIYHPKARVKFRYNPNRDFSDEISKEVMDKIDHAKLLDYGIIETPFGRTLFEKLSSGCQALLLAIKEKDNDVWVSFASAGDNVIELAFDLSKRFNLDLYIYLSGGSIAKGLHHDFEINGKVFKDSCFCLEINKIVSLQEEAEFGEF